MKPEPSIERTGNDSEAPEILLVTSLSQLDALVGKYVTSVTPLIYWEDTCTQWRFDSLPEALEAMRDPFFTSFAPEQNRTRSSLREVHDYPCYTTELTASMEVVKQLSAEAKPLSLRFEAEQWSAGFPGANYVRSAAPAVAICLAALRTRSIEVELRPEPDPVVFRLGSLDGRE